MFEPEQETSETSASAPLLLADLARRQEAASLVKAPSPCRRFVPLQSLTRASSSVMALLGRPPAGEGGGNLFQLVENVYMIITFYNQ